ncbi:Lrp/AsnC family transcriptional regulator [Paralimibaculum aggregatum]|uniref:Lrp/AsnC family transcriptional regulator n=1 Tax=Paralimibaculum aggregatum TaxID=3036245 RepID=A0ABQ6LP87_9RHOB|nr:Lrp/AsnC family transcriptional regulator [Limibaculum sp. NKW23]GMG83542.1 Lrp/AsnC family transcriptional regulator [Limibaculum sp. NKW23]
MAAPEITLDRTDFEILRLLQNDARLMNKQLATAVGLAASSVHERVKRLHALGVIRGSRTELDYARLGYGLSAVIFVTISREGSLSIDALIEDLARIPEVQDIWLVTGRYDLVVTILARDMDHLKHLAYEFLTKRPEISRYETSIAYRHHRSAGIADLRPAAADAAGVKHAPRRQAQSG